MADKLKKKPTLFMFRRGNDKNREEKESPTSVSPKTPTKTKYDDFRRPRVSYQMKTLSSSPEIRPHR